MLLTYLILSEKFRNFVAMRYGGNNDLKEETIYFSGDFEDPIDSLHDHKDLGVTMSADGTFVLHIEGVIKKVRQRIGWVCRTFKCRSLDFMRHIYISLIRPHLDYCSQLWVPGEGVMMDRLERLQRNYLLLVPELRDKQYTDQLRMMNIQSLER